MDAEPKNWTKSCDAARELRKDFLELHVNETMKAKDVQDMRLSYSQCPKSRFQSSFRKIANEYLSLKKLGDHDALTQWVLDGKVFTRKSTTPGKFIILISTFYYLFII